MKRIVSFGAALFCLLGWLILLPHSSHSQAENFYAGKNIRLVVGYGAATATDLWARLIARHMPKYIPGSPTIIVQNMPGATRSHRPGALLRSARRSKRSAVRLGEVWLHREPDAHQRDPFRPNRCSLQERRGYP